MGEADEFARLVSMEICDMRSDLAHLRDFDFCWSSCSPVHLGLIRAGLDFIHNSIATLKVGGVAVHTTEYNVSSNEATIEYPNLVLFRRPRSRTMRRGTASRRPLAHRQAAGHRYRTQALQKGSGCAASEGSFIRCTTIFYKRSYRLNWVFCYLAWKTCCRCLPRRSGRHDKRCFLPRLPGARQPMTNPRQAVRTLYELALQISCPARIPGWRA
jgi:hypothetical protein